MTERREIQIPVWCSALCRNAYNEKCVEECSVNRDCFYFEEKPGLKVGDMPRFPETKEMTKEEKFTSVTVYLAKVIDHLKGVENEPILRPIRRRNHDSSRSSPPPENLKIEDLLFGVQERNSPPQDRTERQDSPNGSTDMDRKTGNTASV